MDDKTRFDQLKELLVELLHKQDRTIEEVGRLRAAIATQQLLLARLRRDVNRAETEVAAGRRLANEAARVLNRGVEERTAANLRSKHLLRDAAVILAENKVFQGENRREPTKNEVFREGTRTALAETHATLTQVLNLSIKP